MLKKIEQILDEVGLYYSVSKFGGHIEEIKIGIYSGDYIFQISGDLSGGFCLTYGDYYIYIDHKEELPLLKDALQNIKETLSKLKQFDSDIQNLKNTISKLEKLQNEAFADGWCGLRVDGKGFSRDSKYCIERDARWKKEQEEAYNQYMEKKYGKNEECEEDEEE